MHKVMPGDTIDHIICEGCGAKTPVKVNRNMCCYADCRMPVGEFNGKPDRCYYRQSWGRGKSKNMIEAFEKKKQKGEEKDNGEANRKPDDNASSGAAPEPEPAKPAGGVANSIRRFFTE